MSIFERVVCGVDGSPAGLEALRQAKRLLAPEGSLLAATVCDPSIAVVAGWDADVMRDQLRREAADAKAEAERELESLAGASACLLEGSPAQRLLELLRDEQATLVAVGSHGRSRATGIILGGVATTLLHEAPCPVLLARPADDPGAFPRSVVVGVDGSPQSLAAAEVAHELAERFGCSVRAVAATGGKPVDVDGLVKIRSLESTLLVATGSRRSPVERGPTVRSPALEWSERPPVEALLEASAEADLVVVGSRGLHGLAALGSVSERVAHRARCSVLVVRPLEATAAPG